MRPFGSYSRITRPKRGVLKGARPAKTRPNCHIPLQNGGLVGPTLDKTLFAGHFECNMTDENLKCLTKNPNFVRHNVQRVAKSFREACKLYRASF